MTSECQERLLTVSLTNCDQLCVQLERNARVLEAVSIKLLVAVWLGLWRTEQLVTS